MCLPSQLRDRTIFMKPTVSNEASELFLLMTPRNSGKTKYIASNDRSNKITAVKENGLLELYVNDRLIYKKSYTPSTMDLFGFFGVGRNNFQIYDVKIMMK